MDQRPLGYVEVSTNCYEKQERHAHMLSLLSLFFFFYSHTYKLWISWICSCKLRAMMLFHIRTNTVKYYLLYIALVHAAINSVRLCNLVPPKMTLERERERVDNFIPKLQLLHGTWHLFRPSIKSEMSKSLHTTLLVFAFQTIW